MIGQRKSILNHLDYHVQLFTEDPDSPAINTNGVWRLRVGHVNGRELHLEFCETNPVETAALRLGGGPTVISVADGSLDLMSTATLRELLDCFMHSSYRNQKAGQRRHRQLQARGISLDDVLAAASRPS